MTDKPPYGKWAGILLGFLLAGSAHYLSGRRRAGLMWYFAFFAMSVLAIALLVVPGTVPYFSCLSILLVGTILWFVMLKQSYTPVPRIGVLGWIGVVALSIVLSNTQVILIRQFVASYRMSSGSMEPMVLGVGVREMRADSPERPRPYQWILTGCRFRDIKASDGGILNGPPAGGASKYSVGSKIYDIPYRACLLKKPGDPIAPGETLWSGVVTLGDVLVADKLSYRFSNPKRGDLLLFKTDGLTKLSKGEVWLKRIAGLPGERIRIEPPYLIVDDKKVMHPAIFQTIASKADGHVGFLLAEQRSYVSARLVKPTDELVLGKDEYFVIGDNTGNSLDSRYWGPVPKKNIIGKVTRVFWPFTRFNALDGQ